LAIVDASSYNFERGQQPAHPIAVPPLNMKVKRLIADTYKIYN